jgi:hypothetical protein
LLTLADAVPAGRVRIGYARASTVRQSLDTQADSLRASGVTRVFAEKISTRAVTRPELDKAVALARELRASGVAVTIVVHEHKRHPASCSPSWPRCRGMEREYIRDRTLEGHESARARGKAIGGAAVTDDAMLAVALHLRGQELSLRDIAARLVITTGKKKGQHPSQATVLRDHDEKAVPAGGWPPAGRLPVVLVGSIGVADGPGGQVRKDKAAGAVDAQVLADERGQAGHVLLEHRVALGPELTDSGVQVDGRPEGDAVQDEAGGQRQRPLPRRDAKRWIFAG